MALDQERSERMNIEAQLRDRARSSIDLQSRCDTQTSEMQARWVRSKVIQPSLICVRFEGHPHTANDPIPSVLAQTETKASALFYHSIMIINYISTIFIV